MKLFFQELWYGYGIVNIHDSFLHKISDSIFTNLFLDEITKSFHRSANQDYLWITVFIMEQIMIELRLRTSPIDNASKPGTEAGLLDKSPVRRVDGFGRWIKTI